jgi:sodium transport system ATP-binding protein
MFGLHCGDDSSTEYDGGTLMNEIISAERLCKTFKLSARQQKLERSQERLRVAVDHLSLSAFKGEIFGLLGPNGAGKTTTLRMLATLIKPDSGDAFVGGHSVVNEPGQVRAAIGFLTSELKLEDFFTPDYLFDFFSTLHKVPADVAAKRKQALFARFGIDEFAEVKIANLSTGMKQKVSLVISIVHDPSIIIFDEPTNGLDVITAKVVTDYLLELRSEGKSIILSTHIFGLAEKLCDRVGIIIDGRMTAVGALTEVCAGRDLEQVFFDLYVATHGEVA